MKKIFLFSVFLFLTFTTYGQSQRPFVFTWKTDFGEKRIKIPTTGTGYNYTVDFGDGTVITDVSGNVSHLYEQEGTYTVSITGDFPRIHFESISPSHFARMLNSIEQWGDIQWTSMEKAFSGCERLELNATDAPDLSQVETMSFMFEDCAVFNSSINHWDVSTITDMSGLFSGAGSFNMPLDQWEVSQVTDMHLMFENAQSFNQPLNGWELGGVTDIQFMFSGANKFNQPLNNWDVSDVTTIRGLFMDAVSFNQPLNNWNVSNVTDMRETFKGAAEFNQNINNWNVSNVTDMSYMFSYSSAAFKMNFNQPLNNWNVGNVVHMEGMFLFAEFFNQSLNSWNVSNVVNMSRLFQGAKLFNEPLHSWNVSQVTNMSRMFEEALYFNQPLNSWNVTNVTNMHAMFKMANSFNSDIGNWNVSNVTDMSYMFAGRDQNYRVCTKFNQPIANWDVSNVTNMESMFSNSEFNQEVNSWDVSSVQFMDKMFYKSNSFNKSLESWNVANVLSMNGMFTKAQNFNQNLSSWAFNQNVTLENFISESGIDLSNYNILLSRFRNLNLQNKNLDATDLIYCNSDDRTYLLTNLGWSISNDFKLQDCDYNPIPGAFITRWNIPESGNKSIAINTDRTGYNYTVDFGDGTVLTNQTSRVVHTYTLPGAYMVQITGSFPKFKISDLNFRSVEQWGDIEWTSMEDAFNGNRNIKINASDSPDLSRVTSMKGMFMRTDFNQSINHWDVSNVSNMMNMFFSATYFNQPLDAWDVSNVENMNGMFGNAKAFNQSINTWNTSEVTNMYGMFDGANSFNQPLDNWNVSNVINMTNLFRDAYHFNQSINNWDMVGTEEMEAIFRNCTYFNQPLDNWNIMDVKKLFQTFLGATNFNQPLNNWDVSHIETFIETFSNTHTFNQPLDSWDVSNAVYLMGVFSGTKRFNQPLNNWDTSRVESFANLFRGAKDFNQPLENWDVSTAYTMAGMFAYTTSFNQPLENWDIINVYNMNEMFNGAASFNQPLNNWDVSIVVDMNNMFRDAISFNHPLDNWDVSNVDFWSTQMFYGATSFNQDLSNWNFNTGRLSAFAAYSGLDPRNYDKLLLRFAQLGHTNGSLSSGGLFYCNEDVRDYLINNLNWSVSGDFQSSECNLITGFISFDENSNGCDPDDIGVNGFRVNINDGERDFSTFSNDGSYTFHAVGSEFDVSVDNPFYYLDVSPESAHIVFTNSSSEYADFCITSTNDVADLKVTFLNLSPARPGFSAKYQLIVQNWGTLTVDNAVVNLVFDNEMQSFESAAPVPSTIFDDEVVFELGSVDPFEQRVFDITMQTFMPPIVEGGDILSFTALVTPVENDITPEDNTYFLDQIVVNSYDPNDKNVMQGSEIWIEEIDRYLDYVIRFQNTGTASAVNVRITDTLDSKLDWNSFLPMNASHDYRTEVSNGNEVEFIFDNINLPHEGANEPESHGYVAFKIRPKSDVQVGDIISGNAGIYFDFNPPIITNTVSTEVVDGMVGITDPDLTKGITIFPNPTSNILNIYSKDNFNIEEIFIYNMFGQEVSKSKQKIIDVSSLNSGVYFLKIFTQQGTVNRKFIKITNE